MRQPDYKEAGYEPWPRILDLPTTSRSQRREGKGYTMALSYVHLGQRLELAIAGRVIGKFIDTVFLVYQITFSIVNPSYMLLFILCLFILSHRAGLVGCLRLASLVF
jgi:hypothetical protein